MLFTAKTYNAKICSDKCRKVAKTAYSKEWIQINKDHIAGYNQQYYLDNKEKRIKHDKLYRATKMSNDPVYKIRQNLRKRLNKAISIDQKAGSAVRDLGCSIEELKKHLESKWQLGMSWNNYGRKKDIRCWHIDHIIALANFDLSDREQFLKACHYTNLQPLWEDENQRKYKH